MMENPFFNYCLVLFKKILELQKATQEAFRVVSIKTNNAGESVFKIQMTGKSTIFEATPRELAGNDTLLEGFSKKDVRIITYYATKETVAPKYKVLVQDFEEETNRTIFKLGKRGEPHPLKRTANEISSDKNLLNDMTQQDAHSVGYVAAMECVAQEKEAMKRLAQGAD